MGEDDGTLNAGKAPANVVPAKSTAPEVGQDDGQGDVEAEGIQTPTNSSVGAIDQRIRSRTLEAVSCRPNRDDGRVCVIT